MWIFRVEGCLLVLGPILAATVDIGIRRPLGNGLFMVAKLVQHRSVFDEDSLE